MAKKAKDKPRRQKLKVFRTPIGFHDAYVAAPSRKAALDAWGADANIFAQGIAEEVTDPKLMEEPLARPGEVFKVRRGSAEEHVAELAKSEKAKGKNDGASRIKSGMTTKEEAKPRPRPKPSRRELDAAEEALEKAEKKQRKRLRDLDDEMRALERKRRELQRKHEAERDELAERRDRARAAYERALRAWDR